MEGCEHLRNVTPAQFNRAPNTPEGCEECLKLGDRWVQLRLCLTCGHVGCCDSSKNKHATRHYHETQHPVMRSYQAGKPWAWCYADEVMAETSAE